MDTLSLLKKAAPSKHIPKSSEEYFKGADRDNSKNLTKTECENLFKTWNLGDMKLDKYIRMVDTNGDKKLNLEEFTKLKTHLRKKF